MNELLSASSVASRSEKDHSSDEDEQGPVSGAQVLKKLNLRKESFKLGSEMSMDADQEEDDSDTEDYPKPQNKKKAKRSLTSKNFKFGSSKSLVSQAKKIVQNIDAESALDKVDEDDCISEDSASCDSLSQNGE